MRLFVRPFLRNISVLTFACLICFALWSARGRAATNIVVNSTADPGTGVCDATECTLREAITAAEANPGADVINVAVIGTVALSSSLPTITQSLIINGGSQTGFIVDAQGVVGRRPFTIERSGAVVEMNNLTIRGGNVTAGGGGIRVQSATLNLTNVTVNNNISAPSGSFIEGGGGIYVSGGTLNVVNLRVAGNSVSTSNSPGGGILVDSGTLTMTSSTVSGNTALNAPAAGGGLAMRGSTARIENSTVDNNQVNGDGGGLYFAGGGSLRMSNVTVSRNEAIETGGGLRLEDGNVILRNVTVGQVNRANTGGGIYSLNTAITLANTIIGGDNRALASGRDFYAQNTTITRLAANVVQFGIIDGGGNTINGAGTIQQVDPLFAGGLVDNSGQVQTIALASNSPARDAGTNSEALDTQATPQPLATDARGAGFPRILDSDGNNSAIVDLGAFEAQPPNNAPAASATPNPAQTSEDTAVQITLTGTDANNNNLSFTITDTPDHGTLSGQDATPSCSTTNGVKTCTLAITYTPVANYNGSDLFKFKVNDGTVDSAEATVNITVHAVADLSISDVTRAEGNSDQTTFAFTVTLDSPAPAGGVTFDASTYDGATNPATSGSDYTGFTLQPYSISQGQTSTTINVQVNGDTAQEANETFSVVISNPVNGTISDGEGTGTILNDDGSPSAGQIIISEFRLRGPAPSATPVPGQDQGQLDEFIELYNTTDSDFVVVDSSPLPALASRGWAIVSDNPLNLDPTELTTAKFTIPVGTRIPARGHYLVTNALGYSLSALTPADVVPQEAGGGAASYNADIADGSGLALYRTGNPASFTPDQRLDAVGFTGSTFFEGTPLTPAGGINTPLQHSFVRKLPSGLPQDTQDNEADFQFVEVTGATSNGRTAILGAPGPENSQSPIQRNAVIKASLIAPTAASTAPPNRVRSGQVVPGVPNAYGTLSIQRRFRNATNSPVTRLRFRVVDITTRNSPVASAPQADMRVLSSTGVVNNSQGTEVVRVTGLTLEEPPVQANGGGLNSTLTVVLPGGMLAPGNTIDVQFLLGVQEQGTFRFLVNVEALTGLSPETAGAGSNRKSGVTRKAVSGKEN